MKTIYNHNKLTYCLLLVITVLCLSACEKESHIIIEAPFQEYVDIFFLEAEKRNIKISKNNLEVVFQDHRSYCGLGDCSYQDSDIRRVEINPNCWELINATGKEILMFHELGHALLKRQHKNTKFPNGSFRSIMHNGSYISVSYTHLTLPTKA